MARKIFVSYKYGDRSVLPLNCIYDTTVRHYVDVLQARLDKEDHINKGEEDGTDLSGFTDETIASKLRDKIYDSSITLVLMSKNMREVFVSENDQWIPWEISYSLKEHSRDGRTSTTNAVIAVVVPDESGSYEYFIKENTCPSCNSKTIQTDSFFNIIRSNMFNRKEPKKTICNQHGAGNEPHIGNDHSYIYYAKWDDFIGDINSHLNTAIQINENIDDYNIEKTM